MRQPTDWNHIDLAYLKLGKSINHFKFLCLLLLSNKWWFGSTPRRTRVEQEDSEVWLHREQTAWMRINRLQSCEEHIFLIIFCLCWQRFASLHYQVPLSIFPFPLMVGIGGLFFGVICVWKRAGLTFEWGWRSAGDPRSQCGMWLGHSLCL